MKRSPVRLGVDMMRKNATCTHDTAMSVANESRPCRPPSSRSGRPRPALGASARSATLLRTAKNVEAAIMRASATNMGTCPCFVSSSTKYRAKASVNDSGMANSAYASS